MKLGDFIRKTFLAGLTEKRVREFGGTIQRSKIAIGEFGFITLAVDTKGKVFGIHSLE